VADKDHRLSSHDRETLLRTARSRQSTHGVATRARLVVDCADLGVAEAARRSSVSRATVAKWWRRYLDAGVDGLHDIPHTGRPPAPDEVVHRVLSCALDEPPAGTERWTTRTIADVAGVSQATVSRIRRSYFRRLEPNAAAMADLSTSILTYVDVHPSGCALGFQASSGASAGGTSAARTDVIETIVSRHCSARRSVATARRQTTLPRPSRCSAVRPNGFRCRRP
jgi:transposase